MSTKKLQIIGSMNADTLDGKHASDFASAEDLVNAQGEIDALQTLVGDAKVSDQISEAIAGISAIPDSEIIALFST